MYPTAWLQHAGKVIVKHEDHILWVESLLMRNLGPVSRFFNRTVRRQNGRFFCFLGNFIYAALAWVTNMVSSVFLTCIRYQHTLVLQLITHDHKQERTALTSLGLQLYYVLVLITF